MSNCLRIALNKAGIDTDISVDIPIENMPNLCKKLKLDWHGSGTLNFYVGEPVIVIYKTAPGRSHAVFTTDARLLRNIIGLITFGKHHKEKTNV